MTLKRRIKRIFRLHNLAIIACIIVIVGAIYFIFKPEKAITFQELKIVSTNTKKNKELSKEDAKKAAVKQFKNLGENVSEEDLNIRVILRGEDKYYYIKSKKNTMEIKVIGGEVTRINTALVNE